MTNPPPNGYPGPHNGIGYDPTQQYQRPAPGPYNQATTYGQPQYGHAPYGQAPHPGPHWQPAPYGPPPQKPKSPAPLIIGIVVLVVLVAAAAVALVVVTGDSDDAVAAPSSPRTTDSTPTTSSPPGGETVRSTAVGSCITVTGSLADVKTKGVSCDDVSPPSYIVGAKLASKDACEAAGYYSYVYEYGIGASRDYLCLVPNWQVDTCYEQSTIGIELTTVACSLTSTVTTTRFKVTERVDGKRVPNCAGSESLKVFAFDIRSSPARQVGFCAEILGDYVWE